MSDEIKQPPDYPVTCARCGVKYGPGGEVGTHRPGSVNCMDRERRRDAEADAMGVDHG